MQSQYRILGTNDDEHSCCLCGRTDLKRVVWLENTEDGSVGFYGTECAAKLLSATQSNVKKWAERADRVQRFLSSRMADDFRAKRGDDFWSQLPRAEQDYWLRTLWAA